MLNLKNLLSPEALSQIEKRKIAQGEIKALMDEREGKEISWKEWQEMRGNSYFQEEILPFLDSEALSNHAEHCRSNASFRDSPYAPAVSYDEILMAKILPEMIRRLNPSSQKK